VDAAVGECVKKALDAANSRPNVPLAIPKEASPEVLPTTTAQPAAFVAPPRTIKDIAAILDAEQPNTKKIEQLKAEADATPTAGGSRHDLAWFHYRRGSARAQLGRIKEAIEDANTAIEVGQGAVEQTAMSRFQQFAGVHLQNAGNLKQALAMFLRLVHDSNVSSAKGWLFNGYRHISLLLIRMGDISQADMYLRRNLALIQEARTSRHPAWRATYAEYGHAFEADIAYHRALMFEARGQFREAEGAYRESELHRRLDYKRLLDSRDAPLERQTLANADVLVLSQSRMKARQGRLAEAEVDARRALLSRLKAEGKYNVLMPNFVRGLSDVLVEQGRYAEAERPIRVALDINQQIGVPSDSKNAVGLLAALGRLLNIQGKLHEAGTVYAELDKAIAQWSPQRREVFELNGSRINSLFVTGQIESDLTEAQAFLKREMSRVGETHFDTAVARGMVAIGYMRAGKQSDAIREFKAAIPVLISAVQENADIDDASLVLSRTRYLQWIAEAYVGLRAGVPTRSDDVAIET